MDIAIIESLNGGEFVLRKNDLQTTKAITNTLYLALFGGNLEQSTKERKTGDVDKSFWGNNLLFKENTNIQFNSETERLLQNISLGSSARIKIEEAIKKDLKYLKDVWDFTVSVDITGVHTIKISIVIKFSVESNGLFVFDYDTSTSTIGDFSFLDFNDDFF